MFGFHFRVKSSSHNGKNVSALEHAKYISRDDKYKSNAEIENQDNLYTDILTGKDSALNLPKQARLIYESPFGNIKLSENGIMISKGASVETVAIALSVGEKIYGQDVSVKGSKIFKEKNIKAASELNLPIKFLHRTLEKKSRTEKERIENDRREFTENGGRYYDGRIRIRGRRNEKFQKPRTKLCSLKDFAKEGFCLPRLFKRDVDSNA